MSGGKANLHQGAVGVGVDMATGRTLGGVWCNQSIADHPDTGENIQGVLIPGWRALLRLAAGCYELTRLGYIGVDLVLDKDKGPMILELNARPGLSIQIANNAGLMPRLNAVEAHATPFENVAERVSFAMENFCGKIEAPQ
jgi:alpha-L-glutamate ligase-like protein